MKRTSPDSKIADWQPKIIEPYWQEVWEKKGIYEPNIRRAKKPFYNLMMFPYPSAEGLHVGNMYAFCGSDIYGRYKRMKGLEVFEPIGLDGFGIHSENYALKIGEHPRDLAKRTQVNFYRQLHATGNAYSWSHKLETYDPLYYRWTQWIFVQMFKAGLAYRDKATVNWCPQCLTVLADEQVIASNHKSQIPNPKYVCERCESEVVKRELAQWFFRTTAYASELLEALDDLDWSEKVKLAQRNWLGKSEGVEILFACDLEEGCLVKLFTTRPDTIFGVTFMALAPEHPLVIKIIKKTKGSLKQQIRHYVDYSMKKTEIERLGETRDLANTVKTGVFTGFYCLNPLSQKRVPLYIADYVLPSYGTGAVMGVPAHDQRDWHFARKYKIDIVQVIKPTGSAARNTRGPVASFLPVGAPSGRKSDRTLGDQAELRAAGIPSAGTTPRAPTRVTHSIKELSQGAFTDEGVLVNSGSFSGMNSLAAIRSIIKYIEEHQLGSKKDMWHLRDWIISRQRYWGPPIPMIYCDFCAKERKSWFTSEEAKKFKISLSTRNSLKASNLKFKIEMVGWYPVPDEDLPVRLPYIKDFKPKGTGVSPLVSDFDFVKVKCPGCGRGAKRETDVSDTFLDSAWYFLRYPSVGLDAGSVTSSAPTSSLSSDSKRDQPQTSELRALAGTPSAAATRSLELPWDPEITRRWLPVNMYIGGAEHAVLHLLYSRFLTKALADLGLVDFREPFSKFRAHGLLIASGAKMSKSRGNIVNPDVYIEKHGADTLRCYLMFCGRFTQGGDFRDTGIEGMSRFLKRIWRLVVNAGPAALHPRPTASFVLSPASPTPTVDTDSAKGLSPGARRGPPSRVTRIDSESLYMMHKTIKKVTGDIEVLSYNTALAAIMKWVNALEERTATTDNLHLTTDKKNKSNVKGQMSNVSLEELQTLLKLLAPFAPHMSEELYQRIRAPNSKLQTPNFKLRSIHTQAWPKYDEKLAKAGQIELVVEVNGKVRDKILVERGIGQEEAQKLAWDSEKAAKHLARVKLKKVVFVPDRLINFVVE